MLWNLFSGKVALVGATWSSVASASPVQPASADKRDLTTPVLPSIDPWYKVPENITQYEPGAIIRNRPPPSPIAAFGSDPINLAGSHQILYRTTDSLGNATATVLTVLIPHNADFTKVLSYQVAEDACSINCAPSYALQQGHADPGHGTQVTEEEILLIEAAVEMGWVIIVPDFLGPNAAFLANALSGQATLDGIRAAKASSSFTGIYQNPTIAMWGYSGGSVASMWAAELQPSYAPDLEIAGAAVGGVVPNITTVVTTINGQSYAGLIPPGITGLLNQYPALRPLFDEQILPQFKDDFNKAKSQCYQADYNQFENKNITEMFKDPNFIYTNPTAVGILNENALGKHTPKIPMFVYKGMKDEISPYPETDALVNKYCADGAIIYYHRDRWTNHGDLAIFAAPPALAWLKDTFEGRNQATSCSTKTVDSSLFDPSWWTFLPKFLLDALLDLVGKPVGPAS